jgi:butyrate kinase
VHDRELAASIAERVQFLGPVMVHAGEDEMSALALAALRALADPGIIRTYPPRATAESA